MGFKEVMDLDAERIISLGGFDKKTRKANQDQIEGYFLGSKKIASTKNKSGVAYIHIFKTAEGQLGVWGKTDMDRKLLNQPIGNMVRLTCIGQVPTKNGDMYKYKLEVDSDNIIDTSTIISKGFSSGADEEYDEEYLTGDYDSDEEAEEEDLSPEPLVGLSARSAMSAAEKKAKVQELLGRKGKAN